MFVLKIETVHLARVLELLGIIGFHYIPGGEKFCIKVNVEMLDKLQAAGIVGK
jgi:hypothetical protein